MAELSALPALAINPVEFGAKNDALTIQNQQNYDALQQERSLAPYAMAAQKSALQQKTDLDTTAYNEAQLAQIATQTQALDPEERASYWNTQMKALAAKGNNVAAQYVGHYRDDLANNVASIYGGKTDQGGSDASAAAANGPNPQALDMAVANLPVEQVQQSLGNLNKAIDSFNNIKDATSWTAEIASLQAAGIPVEKMLPSLDWSPLNYAAAHRLIQNMVPYRDAMMRAVARQASGVPTPAVPNKVVNVNGTLYAVDPFGQHATPLASTPSYEYEGADKTGGGAPVVFDKKTGKVVNPGIAASTDAFGSFADRMLQMENGTGNPAAKNPNSSAMGNGQFINATWLQEARAQLPQTQGMSDAQVLALRANPQLARQVTIGYAQKNAEVLQNAGMPVTTGTLALAHRLGPDGALKILQSPADTPLAQILPANVIAANPDMRGQTAGTYAKGIIAQMGNAPILTAQGTAATVPGDANLHGDAYLKSIPDQALASDLKAYAEGRIQQPSSFFMKTPYGQMIMRALAQYDPGFDLTLYNSRVAANTDLARGKMGQAVTSFNQAIGHLGNLQDAVTRLENTNFPLINSAVNTWRSQTGDPRITAFNVARNAVADELTRAFRGTGGNESDIASWEKSLNAANSPAQLHAAIQMAVHLLDSRIQAIGQQYNRAMRFNAIADPTTLLSPNARATLARLGGTESAAPKAPPIGTVQKGYRFNGGNPADPNSWVKVQ